MADKLGKEDRRLWRTVVQTLHPFPITAPNTTLLTGVSGGADSLALLHLLRRQLGAARLLVAHLNHKLRPEADEDSKFVADKVADWQIPFIGGEINVAELADALQLSLEAAGRQARYQFFAAEAKKAGATAVAVAHHADDQAETVLLHLLRGSGSAGLRGMSPVSHVPGHEEVPLLRPFLNISRADIEAYCARHGLASRHDESNDDLQFTRNRIRHELLPVLQTYNPQIRSRLQQLAIITTDEYDAQLTQFNKIWADLLTGQGASWLGLGRQQFMALPAAWQRLALRRAIQQLSPQTTEISFQTIELARTLVHEPQSGTEATLPGGIVMQVAGHELLFGDAGEQRPGSVPQLDREESIRLPVPGQLDLMNGWILVAEPVTRVNLPEVQQNKDPWRAFVALAEEEALWLRPSLPGERFQPLGMQGRSQAIQDLLSDRKVPRGQRP